MHTHVSTRLLGRTQGTWGPLASRTQAPQATIARAPGLAHRPRALRPQGTGTRHKPPAVRASTGWMTSMFHTHWDIVFLKTQKASDTGRQPRLSEAPLAGDQAERGRGFRSTGRERAEARGLSGRSGSRTWAGGCSEGPEPAGVGSGPVPASSPGGLQCRPNLPCTLRRGPQSPLGQDGCPPACGSPGLCAGFSSASFESLCQSPTPQPSGTFCLDPHSHSFTMATGPTLDPAPLRVRQRAAGGAVRGAELTSHTCPPRTSSRTGSPARTGSCSPGSSA